MVPLEGWFFHKYIHILAIEVINIVNQSGNAMQLKEGEFSQHSQVMVNSVYEFSAKSLIIFHLLPIDYFPTNGGQYYSIKKNTSKTFHVLFVKMWTLTS